MSGACLNASDEQHDIVSQAAERTSRLNLSSSRDEKAGDQEDRPPVPPLDIVMMVAGTRGGILS